MHAIALWLDRHADGDWRSFHKLWSVQVAVFWAALSGAYVALPAFQNAMPGPYFACACIGLSVVLCLARISGQPGLN
jgi:hypothetical protein